MKDVDKAPTLVTPVLNNLSIIDIRVKGDDVSGNQDATTLSEMTAEVDLPRFTCCIHMLVAKTALSVVFIPRAAVKARQARYLALLYTPHYNSAF